MQTTENPKTASVLFKEFLETVGKGDAKAASSLFATDGYIDAPYVQSLGFPSKIAGHEAIEQSLSQVKAAAPNFHFSNFKVVMETPNELVAEYESEAVMASGKPYKQLYIAHVTTKDGKIVSHKEFLNTVVFVEAFFPNGLKDLITNK
ncbi:MAG TPA: nuclear transport factor 2 family protein [Cyclobacteriaceae bacterium]|jgi:ketosteroid isomerase-like protein|nr:nuclear transport factor 2 family protein [Cyclobacteriaceae bacterium]